MSLGRSITKQGRAAVVASLTSTPREPLLFLYPQWMKNSFSSASQAASVRHKLPSTPSTRTSQITSIPHRSLATAAGIDTPRETYHVEHEPSASSTQPAKRPGAENDAQSIISKGVKIRKYAAHPLPSLIKRPGNTHPEAPPQVRRILAREGWAARKADRARRIRQAYQARRREAMQSWVPDWRVILADLRKNTPVHGEWLERAVHISVPESAMEQLFHGVDDNIWNIAKRYGCSARLASRDPTTNDYNSFLLSGPAIAINKTTAKVLRISPSSEVKAMPAALFSTDSKTPTSCETLDSNVEPDSGVEFRPIPFERSRTGSLTRADKFPRPSEWTTQTFADYVEDLTSIKLPNHLHRLMYNIGEDHIEMVASILRKIFADSECKSSISRTAFNSAIDFFVKTNHIRDARVFFVHMEMMKLPMDPDTFNALLRGAAKSEDLHNFHFVLHLMLRRHVSPNGQTWVAFMMAAPDLRIKLHILASMKEKGLLSHLSTLKAVCEQIVSQEIAVSLDQGQSQEEFLNHMDSRYGKNWLKVDTGNRILHALGGRCLISRCWEFLHAMDARFVKPDQVSINTILNHCKQQRNVSGAIEVMKNLPPFLGFVPDEMTYHALFEMAWRAKSYNLARVVWRYACLNAGTTRRMRTLVHQSFYNAVLHSPKGLSPSRRWGRQAGLFIIRSKHFDVHPTAIFDGELERLPSASDLAPGLELEHLSKEPGPLRKVDIDRLIECDLRVFEGWIPSRPFGEMLAKAWERDRQWKSPEMHSDFEKLDAMFEGAIAVPVRRRPGSENQFDWEWR